MVDLHHDEPTWEDKLNRSSLRNEINAAITKCAPPQVFGVHGDWGSGKTSFLRQVRFELDGSIEKETSTTGLTANSQDFHGITIWFEAWRYQHEPAPVVALLQEMRRQLGALKRGSDEIKKLSEVAFRTLLNGFDDVAKLLKLEMMATKGVQAAGETWEKEHLAERLPTDSVREFLKQAIDSLLASKRKGVSASNPKLVIFIDDLDRCQPGTAYRLLESLKIHMALPNCVFVLGMNQQVVIEAIASELKKDDQDIGTRLKAEAYLEKICTNVWRLPLPPAGNDFFLSLLEPTLKNELVLAWNDEACLPPNPRRLKALANVANRLWNRLEGASPVATLTSGKPARRTLALLVYAYIYQFHSELFRRWQFDHSFIQVIFDFVNDQVSKGDTQGQYQKSVSTYFNGLVLPQLMRSADPSQPTSSAATASAYPDPSTAGIFWIASLLQKKVPSGELNPADFDEVIVAAR